MTYNWDAVNGAIRVERARRKMSQAELSERSGVSIGTIKNLEGARTYKRPPIGALQDIDRAFGWTAGTLQEKLGGARAGEPEPTYQQLPMSDEDLVIVLHHVVLDLAAHTAPGTTLAELKKLEARALRIAREVGQGSPRLRPRRSNEEDPES